MGFNHNTSHGDQQCYWLKRMFFKSDTIDIIKLDTLEDFDLGCSVMWHSPVVKTPNMNHITCLGCIVKTPDRLMHAPAMEL